VQDLGRTPIAILPAHIWRRQQQGWLQPRMGQDFGAHRLVVGATWWAAKTWPTLLQRRSDEYSTGTWGNGLERGVPVRAKIGRHDLRTIWTYPSPVD